MFMSRGRFLAELPRSFWLSSGFHTASNATIPSLHAPALR